MTWSEHWSVLLSGSVASMLSLVGVFVVFWLTTRHDRLREQRQRELDAVAAADASRSAAIARIHRAVAMQPKDTTLAPIFGNAEALELLAACLAFSSELGKSHPEVAAWVMQQHSRVHRARQAYWWWAWIPGLRNGRARRWGSELAVLGAALLEWQLGQKEDQWFREHLESLPTADAVSLQA